MNKLTHFDSAGEAHMVDVGDKPITQRTAVAQGRIVMQAETLKYVIDGKAKKGDVLSVARIAAIMATKRTADLIPLCHPLSISKVSVDFSILEAENAVTCKVTVKTSGPTGVEMEALTGVQIGLLTIYDMCKAVDRGMVMTEIQLLEKSGGQSGNWRSDSVA